MNSSRPKPKGLRGTPRTVLAISVAAAIGAASAGIAQADTAGHGQDRATAGQSAHSANGKRHPFGLGALPSRPQGRNAVPSGSVESRLEALSPYAKAGAAKPKKASKPLPAAVDLSKFAATPGNQGDVNSCVAWAIDYSAYSILEGVQKISGGPQAPMYTYAQIVKGRNDPTAAADHFRIATKQGVDSRKHYKPGDFNYTTQPSKSERRNAANWKLSGYTTLRTGSRIQNDVKSALSKGQPVVIMIPVRNDLYYLTPKEAASYKYYPARDSGYAGNHMVTIIGYNSKGVRVENSWGKGWGDRGFVNFSWKYLQNQVVEADAVGKIVKR
ncbi:C1 family peptidase [Streptomyces sp. AV19]|uniref:C1 family peptidase n=1 Tax=Streptomyces sp. AV19 TaxID=2793068 RepID=UPI0018FE0B28|nr:C1 family peptidase [Streptomyces sp. AV19]MBH1936416.1 C1 family peptidase [Streptomyces sp. AV19]MDG4532465.1 C1 family peptidase [Streptomyces sp. AV19]